MLVQPLLDEPSILDGHASLHAFVDEVARAVAGQANPHETALDQRAAPAGAAFATWCREVRHVETT
jgi:hypothetical protein